MKTIGRLAGVFWATCLGIITLFVFFSAMGAISPRDVGWLTAATAVIAVLCAIHFVRVRRALGDHRHDELARAVHAMREHRGF